MGRQLLCAGLLMLAASAWACEEIFVSNVWVRESVPGQTSASLQLNLTVTKNASLVGARTPWAESVEIHFLSPGHGKMEARRVPTMRLPRNRTLVFGERKLALMMMGLKQPLHVGDRVPVSLTVEFANKRLRTVEAEAEVRPLALSYRHYQKQNVYDHK